MALSYQQLLTAVNVVISGGNVPNIVGDAGIGKSALVADLARQNNAKLFTTVVSLSEKGDLAIPVPPLTADSFVQTKQYGKLADVQFGYSHQLIEIIQFAERHPEVPIYWFLDEFNRGSQGVQSELMNLVLQRSINSLKLPEQVHIIIAENPDATMSDFADRDYHVVSGDDAIKDRTVRLVMRTDINDWLNWATTTHSIHPRIIDYLTEHPEMLSTKVSGDDLFPTPRAWERLSNNYQQLLKLSSSERQAIQLDVFAGDIGTQTAVALQTFLNQADQQVVSRDVFTSEWSDARTQFMALDQVGRVAVIKAALERNQGLEPPFVERLDQLLQLINPDGQYACGLALVTDSNKLAALYKNAQNGTAGFKALYQRLEQIGFDTL
ncbi:ATP-binding protein [Nicoliella spurrieriana]|uniref:ATP-binding protein n=1 Tax=Nicoliella spurrieriana TaxID=2925830 RepID=A0A976RRR5_9LACO|nr:ATP-binding protein [Nicoliella spurrieriana]UQS86629.1 ATP-binding protein [Nicoliella spurrieriana]